jgi:hypothetical protein
LTPRPSPPFGAIALAVLAALLYLPVMAGLHDAGHSDAAGNAINDAFVALLSIALWIVLAGLLLIAFVNGRMPGFAALGALVLVPLAGYASFAAADLHAHQRFALIVPALTPPVIVLYALWVRIPAALRAISETAASALAGGALLFLIAVSVLASQQDARQAPARQAAQQAAHEKMRAEEARVAAEDRARDAEKFAALNADSPLRDFLEYLNGSDARARVAMEGARHANSRQADTVALLRDPSRERLVDLRELWQLDLAATPELCQAYATQLGRSALKIDRGYSKRLGEAIDLEFQLPNLQWLAPKCELRAVLTDLAKRLRAVRDSSRIDKLADAMDALAGTHQPQ